MTKAGLDELKKYLDMAPEEMKNFILEKCEIYFNHMPTRVFFKGCKGRCVNLEGKHKIYFENDKPKPFTFFHEVGHAHFNHKDTFDDEVYIFQEKEADDFAKEIFA